MLNYLSKPLPSFGVDSTICTFLLVVLGPWSKMAVQLRAGFFAFFFYVLIKKIPNDNLFTIQILGFCLLVLKACRFWCYNFDVVSKRGRKEQVAVYQFAAISGTKFLDELLLLSWHWVATYSAADSGVVKMNWKVSKSYSFPGLKNRIWFLFDGRYKSSFLVSGCWIFFNSLFLEN